MTGDSRQTTCGRSSSIAWRPPSPAQFLELPDRSQAAAVSLAGKRIVFVLASLELGGAERQALLLARRLKQHAGANVVVAGVSGSPGRVAEMCERDRIPCQTLGLPDCPGGAVGLPGWMYWAWRFARAARRLRPDVLVPYCSVPNILCSFAWRWTGAKVYIWNQRDAGITPSRAMERFAACRASCLFSNSTAGSHYLVNACRVPPDRIHFVPNGVAIDPPQADRPTWRRRLRLENDHFAACMVANLHENKDHETLIRAWRRVVDRLPPDVPPPILLLAGRWGNRANALNRLAHRLAMYDEVRFLGPVEDVTGLLEAADLAVFSSVREGCPNAILEAMAIGLPVVATDVPGTRDALGDDATGCLVPPGDPDAFAALVHTVWRDRDLRARLAQANRQRIAERFAEEKSLAVALDALAMALGAGVRRGPVKPSR